jgi:hypothetical protein
MTAWKAQMLDELFVGTDTWLEGSTAPAAGRLVRVRAFVHERWDPSGDRRFLEEFVRSMPEGYLLSNTPAEIAARAMLAYRGRDSPISGVGPGGGEDLSEAPNIVAPSSTAPRTVPLGAEFRSRRRDPPRRGR